MPPPPEGRAGSSRSTPRMLWMLALGLLVLRVVAGVYESRNAPRVVELIEWQPIEGSIEKARATGKPILYDFTADWCPPCHAMAKEVFADRRMATMINSMFVPVRVLDRQREEGRNTPDVAALQARYQVEAFPTLVVVSPGGSPERIEGFAGAKPLMDQLGRLAVEARMRGTMKRMGVPDSVMR